MSPYLLEVKMRPDRTPSVESFEDLVHTRRDLLRLMRKLPKTQRFIVVAYYSRAALVKKHAAELVAAWRDCTSDHGYALIRGAVSNYERVLVEHEYVRDLSGLGEAPR